MPRIRPVVLANGSKWPNKTAAKNHFRTLRDRWPVGVTIDGPEDHDDLCALLERYDEVISTGPSKIGSGIHHFETRENNSHGGVTIGFWVIRGDRSETDFSFIDAVDGYARNPDAEFVEACREAVYESIAAAKRQFFQKYGGPDGRAPCEITGELLSLFSARADYTGRSLRDISWDFRVAEGWSDKVPEGIVSPPTDAQVAAQFVDIDTVVRFRAFHETNAKMRIVSKSLLPSKLATTRNVPAVRPLLIGAGL